MPFAVKSLVVIAGLAMTLVAGIVAAQDLETPVSPSPVGSGARAAGMADAFVAIADDATAASWNPAGLVQLESPEFSFVGSFNTVVEAFLSDGSHPEFPSSHNDDSLDVNFLSFVYPLPFLIAGRNATLSLSYQQKFDLSRNFDVNFISSTDIFGSTFTDSKNFRFNQDGSLGSITPAFAIEVTHRLSVGLAVNLWRDNPIAKNEFRQTINTRDEISVNGVLVATIDGVSIEEYKNVEGENFVVGVLWNATEKLNIGLRYNTAFTADTDYTRIRMDSIGNVDNAAEKRRLRFPDTWTVGASYRVNDRLTLAFDTSITDWDDFTVETAAGETFSLVDASNVNDPDERTNFKPTKTFRLGAEYVFLPKEPEDTLPRLWSLRGGLFYDEEPASGRPSGDRSIEGDGKPDSFFGFTVGAGLLAFQRVNIDLAYQLRYGNGVNGDFVRGVPGFEEDIVQHRVLLSTVIYF